MSFSGVLYFHYAEANRINHWAIQQYEVLRNLRVVLTDLLNAETGMRGYLLTTQDEFLQPYHESVRDSKADLEAMLLNGKANPDLKENIDHIYDEALAFQTLLATDEQLLRTQGKAIVTADIIANQKARMDQLRYDIDTVTQQSRNNLDARLEESQLSSRHVVYILLAGTLSSIGALLFATFVIVALTEKAHRADANVRENEQRFFTVMNGINDGLFDFNVSDKTIYYSPSYRAMLGYTEAEHPNTTEAFQALMHPDDALRTMEISRKYRERELPSYSNVFRMRHKDGTWRWILSRGIGMWDTTGQMTRLIGTHTDITEQKNREEELKQVNAEMESFTYTASHDLRSPLVNLKGFAGEMEHALHHVKPIIQRLQPTLPDDEQKTLGAAFDHDIPEALTFIKKSVEKMDALITAVLDLSRIGKREYNFTLVDTNQLVRRCLDAMAYEIGQKKIEVMCSDLPQIISDPIVLEQVFSNILDNAIKYLEPGRPGHIVIAAQANAGDVVFSIADNGRGIADLDREKIFEIFRRARNTADVRGLGMGMAFVKASLRKLGGSIDFESRVNEGTRFYFNLPVKPV